MQSKLKKVKNALTGIEGLNVYHYFRPKLPLPYCIWAEDSTESLSANDRTAERIVEGTVDYFTKEEFDTAVDSIENALNDAADVAWKLNSVQYDDETGTVHYEWVFKVL